MLFLEGRSENYASLNCWLKKSSQEKASEKKTAGAPTSTRRARKIKKVSKVQLNNLPQLRMKCTVTNMVINVSNYLCFSLGSHCWSWKKTNTPWWTRLPPTWSRSIPMKIVRSCSLRPRNLQRPSFSWNRTWPQFLQSRSPGSGFVFWIACAHVLSITVIPAKF